MDAEKLWAPRESAELSVWRNSLSTVVDRGLEGVVVGTTHLSNVEGTIGRLTYRGYDIDDLAPSATF